MKAKKHIFSALKALVLFLLTETKSSYYIRALLMIFLGLLLSNTSRFPLVKLLIIGIGVSVSLHFYKTAQKLKSDLKNSKGYEEIEDLAGEKTLEEDNTYSNRTINTNGGNYNETIKGNYIQGDFIQIQGHQINVSQDVLEVIQQLQQIQVQLQYQGVNTERIESYIINDLTKQVHDNSRLRKMLFQWANQLENSSFETDEVAAAEALVEYAFSLNKTLPTDLITVASGRYQKLYELLQKKDWKHADEETARLIFSLSDKDFDAGRSQLFYRDRLTARDIDMLSGKDLNSINTLWVKTSNECFGFSIQKYLWKRYEDNTYKSLESFGSAVGWRVGNHWISHSDSSYLTSLTSVPEGHFPAIVMMRRSSSNHPSCEPNSRLFRAFMKRIYTV